MLSDHELRVFRSADPDQMAVLLSTVDAEVLETRAKLSALEVKATTMKRMMNVALGIKTESAPVSPLHPPALPQPSATEPLVVDTSAAVRREGERSSRSTPTPPPGLPPLNMIALQQPAAAEKGLLTAEEQQLFESLDVKAMLNMVHKANQQLIQTPRAARKPLTARCELMDRLLADATIARTDRQQEQQLAAQNWRKSLVPEKQSTAPSAEDLELERTRSELIKQQMREVVAHSLLLLQHSALLPLLHSPVLLLLLCSSVRQADSGVAVSASAASEKTEEEESSNASLLVLWRDDCPCDESPVCPGRGDDSGRCSSATSSIHLQRPMPSVPPARSPVWTPS